MTHSQRRNRLFYILLPAMLLITVDQISKLWVYHHLHHVIDSAAGTFGNTAVIHVTNWLNIVHVQNAGVAFGLFADGPEIQRWFFISISLLVSVWIVVELYRSPHAKLGLFGLVFILSGALGNAIDRLWLGRVIDFVDLYWRNWHWPAFNVADSAISVGVTMLIVNELLLWRRSKVAHSAP